MKLIKTLLGTAGLLAATLSNAAVYNFQYLYNGASLTAAPGYSEMFGTNLAVGDTVNLTYKAVGSGSYWDFSGVGNAGNVNLGFTYPDSCGSRSSAGAYAASLDGSTLLSSSYTVGGQSCIHLGPNFIDFTGISQVDTFEISYTMTASGAANNVIGSYAPTTWWQVWELFNGTVAGFHYAPDAEVPEPATLGMLALGIFGLGFASRRRKQ